jgi:ABC-type sulfate transport system substrate-binding protein
MSLMQIKEAVTELSSDEFAELNAFMRERENAEWDRQIDEDFAQGGRLREVYEEVLEDSRAGRVEEMP